MKEVIATIMGFLASGPFYLIVVSNPLPPPTPAAIVLSFWIASSILLLRGARTVTQVIGRGFLLGAGVWVLILVATIVLWTFLAPDRFAGLVIRAIIFIGMAVLCLAGFAAVQFWQRVRSPSVTHSD